MADNGKTSFLYDRTFNRISEVFSQKANIAKLNRIFDEIVDRNMEALSSSVPDKTVFISPKVLKKYYELLGIEPVEFIKAVSDSSDIKDHWQTVKNSEYLSLYVLMIYFFQVKNDIMARKCAYMCSLFMYKNIRPKFFRNASEATSRIMQYTISRLNAKSDFYACKNVQNTILKKTGVFYELWTNSHLSEIRGVVTDKTVCNMINDNHSRYKKLIVNFNIEFRKDRDEGKYMNIDHDIDDGETFIQSTNASQIIEEITYGVMSRFDLSSGPDRRLIRSITGSIIPGCSYDNLCNMAIYIFNSKDNELEKIVRLILHHYLFEMKRHKEDIKSKEFISEMLDYYKKLTVTDKNLVEMKELIGQIFERTTFSRPVVRKATINDCKKAVYLYILYYIVSSLVN